MTPEPLIDWSHVLSDVIEFVGALLAAGAVGFRFAVLPGALPRGTAPTADERTTLDAVLRIAAILGLVGALIGLWHLAESLPAVAERRHLTVGAFLQATPAAMIWVVAAVVAAAGYLAATIRVPFGWTLALIGVAGGALRNLATGQVERLAKPVHVLAAGLWIGTLAVLVIAALLPVLRSRLAPDRRGALVAGMVRGFSPLALVSAGLLAALGVYLSWRELGGLAALATPYGKALIVKVALVGVVLALGAFNWKRVKPKLGSEAGARTLLGTATIELVAAFLVLVATAVLVGMPSPH